MYEDNVLFEVKLDEIDEKMLRKLLKELLDELKELEKREETSKQNFPYKH
ncbi:hypothetical protein J4526_07550 [Desulfurococcaceae archaeon MEX13E-LK6-19]|nr:hypothetical protein J4526_07550 [Desulfurococcaceae archaeon MEX13E-LK6-19]